MKIICELKIPRKFINDFDAFDVLDLSKEEHEIIRNIWYHTKNTNCENLIACYDKGKTDILNDGLYSKVMLPKNIVNKKNLKIYHGHTDISCLSKIDLLKLSKDNVICVSCVTYNGYVYVVRKRDRSIYSESEMSDKYDIIKNDVANDILMGKYGTMNMEEMNYVLIHESMLRFARFYEFIIEGGHIDEE